MGSACIVDIQFVFGNDDRRYAKEVAIVDAGANPRYMDAAVLVFKAPYHRSNLDEKARKRNDYIYDNITGLNWNNDEDSVRYSSLSMFVSDVMRDSACSTVYVNGAQKKRFLTDEVFRVEFSPEIVDLREIGCPALKTLRAYDDDAFLPECEVKRHREDAELLCSLRNVNKLHRWIRTIAGGLETVRSKIERMRQRRAETEGSQEPKIATCEQTPRHENMRDRGDRLATFDEWPLQIKQRPEELASAGFFYTGKSDAVVCFHCDLGLNRWETTDNPFEEHLKHAKFCNYINEKKTHSPPSFEVGGKYDARNYRNRLESFANRDLGLISRHRHSPEELAASGLYFYEGRAVCCECETRVPATARAIDEMLTEHCKKTSSSSPPASCAESKDVCGR